MHPWRVFAICSLVTLTACRSSHPFQPAFSEAVFAPNGNEIVFTAIRGEDCFLYSATISTGVARRLTGAGSGCETYPAFSPDGQNLAFMTSRKLGEYSALALAKADGSEARTLVSNGEDNLKPVFVPYSSNILFLRSGAFEHHSPLADNNRHKFDLFSVNSRTGQVSALTHQKFYELGHVSISSDGKQILYSLDTYPEGDRFLIAPIEHPEQPTVGLQPDVPNSPKENAPIYEASWLPDAKSLLFEAASEPAGGGNFDYNVYRLVIASGAIERLTDLTGVIDGLSVSNDGKRAVILHSGTYSVLEIATRKVTPIVLKFIE